jgi:mono/diheme cytochrome c family protein
MRRLIILVTLGVVLAAVLAACGDTQSESTGAATTAPVASATATGSADGAAVWSAQCDGCHQNAAEVSGREAAEVQSVVENGAEGMPGFADTLSAAEIQAVSQYVAGGLQ